jgi:LmbE family N-acetylglucosaminyl deacetylase
MDPVLVLSPHLDDAVLSCGRFLAGRPDAIVATLFTGLPPDAREVQTTYDRDCGFSNALEAMTARVIEDSKALGILGAEARRFVYPDHQYRGDVTIDEDKATRALLAIVDETPNLTTVVGPVGLKHPDHVSAARVFADVVARRAGLDAWVYEDLPSRVLWPEEVGPTLRWWRSMWPGMRLDFLGTGHAWMKEKAIACYRSQLWALDMHTVLVPERFWRLNP